MAGQNRTARVSECPDCVTDRIVGATDSIEPAARVCESKSQIAQIDMAQVDQTISRIIMENNRVSPPVSCGAGGVFVGRKTVVYTVRNFFSAKLGVKGATIRSTGSQPLPKHLDN